MMEGNGTLKIANLGDCGLRVIRKGEFCVPSILFKPKFRLQHSYVNEFCGLVILQDK